MPITPMNGGAGIASLLGELGSGGSGMFSAISGGGQGTNRATSALQSLAGGGTGASKDVDSIVRQQKTEQTRNRIYSDAALRLGYMQEGRYDPKADWEKVAAYAMETGQPVTVSLSSSGRIEAVPQSDSDLSRFGLAQQKQLAQAFGELQEMAGKIKANETNDKWVKTLDGASTVLTGIASGAIAAQSDWERTGSTMTTAGQPFKIALDDKGQITIKDQMLETFGDLPLTAATKLRDAVHGIQDVLRTGMVTEDWQADAQSYMQAGIPYYLDIDPVTNELSAKQNSGDNIVPKFLRDPPYSDVGANTKWKKQASEFISSGKAFFLDFDKGGNLLAKEASAANIIQYSKPPSYNQGLGAGSILSLLA